MGDVGDVHLPVDGRPLHLDVVVVELAGFEAWAAEEMSVGKEKEKLRSGNLLSLPMTSIDAINFRIKSNPLCKRKMFSRSRGEKMAYPVGMGWPKLTYSINFETECLMD